MVIAAVGVSVKSGGTEKDLLPVLAALLNRQVEVKKALSTLGTATPLPPVISRRLKAQLKISLAGREAELKDLGKSAKLGELHTNPSKLERLVKDLDSDITETNAMVVALPVEVEKVRVAAIKALRDDATVKKLKTSKTDSLIDAGIKGKKTPTQVLKDLTDAYAVQDCPDKSRWANYLGLGTGGYYTVSKSGKFDKWDIHVTMSTDSWTGNYPSLEANSPAEIMKKLFKSADWKQLHATLEIGKDSKKYPHIFLYAGVQAKNWPAAVAEAKGKPDWEGKAKAAVQKELDKVSKDLLEKITLAKRKFGQVL